MKASEKKIVELFATANTQFTIPVYQRDYNWQEKHCEILFNDIEKLSKNQDISSHFIGSIVYIHEGVYQIGINQLDIIDGQQRMTTLTLLFLALYYKLKELGDEKKSRKIYNQCIVNEYIDSDIDLKLLPPEENLKILEQISKNYKTEDLEKYKDKNILKNFLYFKERIENYSLEEINKFFIGIEKLIYVDISLEKGKDDPQKIFESLNSTGLDLSQGDLIRNYILMDLERKEQNRIYKEFWISIENNCKVTDGERITNYVSEFIRDYLTLKNNKIPVKSKVFEEFKKFYKGIEDLEEIKEYSKAYSLLIKPYLEKESIIRQHLEYLKILDQTVINPFLIGIIKDYKNNLIQKDDLKEILDILQSYLWRRYVTGEPSNALNKIFQNMYSKVSKEENYITALLNILLNQDFPTNDELKNNLKIKPLYKDKEKLRYVFERIENFLHNETIDFTNEKITIEHILPQKPNKDWQEKYSKEELEEMLKYKDTISNLTLTGSNSNLSNKSFIEKRNIPVYGYKESKLFLNKYLGEQQEWNTLKMNERFEILYENIIKIWKRPEIEKEKKNEEVIFILAGKIGSGQGKLLKNRRFQILKGTCVPKEFAESIKEKSKNFIKELVEKDILEDKGKFYLFKDDYISSPSASASLILGRSANGWEEWKTFNGIKLDNFREKNNEKEKV